MRGRYWSRVAHGSGLRAWGVSTLAVVRATCARANRRRKLTLSPGYNSYPAQHMKRIIGTMHSYLHHVFRRVVPLRWFRVGEDKPPAMILLLRQPHTFSEEEIRAAAERAWGLAFWSTRGSDRRILMSAEGVFLQAGRHQLSFRSLPHPYVPNPEHDADWLFSLSQKKSWSDHRACCWIYYQTATTDLELAHCVIAKVAVELLDGNCTGVWMPSECALIPGEIASEELRSMGAYRSSESSIQSQLT